MNILILSCGTRNKLVCYFKNGSSGFDKVVGTDCSPYAPALYVADSYYIVPEMMEPNYLSVLLHICEMEKIDVVLPLQEDELLFLAEYKQDFEDRNILAAVSDCEKVSLCRDKYHMYQYLCEHEVSAVPTYLWKLDQKKLENPLFFGGGGGAYL